MRRIVTDDGDRPRSPTSRPPTSSILRTFVACWILLGAAGAHPLEAQAGAGTGWTVSSQPLVEIGGSPVDPNHQLFQVVDALRVEGDDRDDRGDGGDASILVANGGTHEIRRYALDGTWLGAFGGEGEGPGEFRALRRIGLLPGDSVHVFDSGLQRLSVFDPSGELVRDQRVLGSGSRSRVTDLVRVGADGWIAIEPEQAEGPRGEMWRDRLHLSARDASMEPVADLGELPGAVWGTVSMSGAPGFRAVPFSPAPQYDVHGRCLVTTSGDDAEVRILLPDGDMAEVWSVERSPEPVTDELVGDLVDGMLEAAGREAPPEIRRQLRDALMSMPRLDHLPLHNQLVADALGYVWLQEYEPPLGMGARWTVLGPGGEVAARLELPVPLRVHQVGPDWILGTWTDALDEPRVRMYRLERGGDYSPSSPSSILPNCSSSSRGSATGRSQA